jgi:DNA repair exonuclease SbcCD ATPase subunit
MGVKINQLQIENVKRVKAVKIEPTQNGLTIIGGKNENGKTSVLDAIAWALGGDKFKPSEPQREGSVIPPFLHLKMSNGLVVERKGKNSDLKVIDPNGQKGGQQLLKEFVEELALDLPKFMQSNNKEKADTLLRIIGVGNKLVELERQETEIYNNRHTIGQIKDQKEKYAKEMVYYPDAPKDLISASELIKQQQDILARNGENQRKRDNLQNLNNDLTQNKNQISNLEGQVNNLQIQIDNLKKQITNLSSVQQTIIHDITTAQKSIENLKDESTAELERNLSEIETINTRVRANLDKGKAEDDARYYADQYSKLSIQLDNVRQAKTDLLNGADLPLPGLSVQDGELTYKGKKWDCMSGSERLKTATAIVRKLNPKCGFVLLDELEKMDPDTLKEFGQWLESEGLQAIATRVSTGDECSIIIEDGYVVGQSFEPEPVKENTWKEGQF